MKKCSYPEDIKPADIASISCCYGIMQLTGTDAASSISSMALIR